MIHRTLLLTLTLWIVGCGGQTKDTPPAEDSPPVISDQRATLQVRLLRPLPGIESSLEEFGRRHGVRVVVVTDAAPADHGGDTVREVEALSIPDLAAAGRIEALRPGSFESADAFAAAATEQGVPWRAQLHGWLTVEPRTWANWGDVARELRETKWGLADDIDLLSIYQPLHAAVGGSFQSEAGIDLTGSLDEEAMAFLHTLAREATRGTPAELLTAWQRGDVGALWIEAAVAAPFIAAHPTARFAPIPTPDGSGEPVVATTVSALVRPVGGPHADLVAELVGELLTGPVAQAIAADGDVPCAAAWTGADSAWTTHLHSLRESATWLTPFAQGERAMGFLRHAIDQTLANKRSPADALNDAQNAVMTHELH